MDINKELKAIEMKINMQELKSRISAEDLNYYIKVVSNISRVVAEDLRVLSIAKRTPILSWFYPFMSKEKILNTLKSSFVSEYHFFLYVFVVFAMNKKDEVSAFFEAVSCKDLNNYDKMIEVLISIHQTKVLKV